MAINNENIHLRDYWRVVSKRRNTVATFFVVTFVAILLGTFIATPQYKGATKVMIEKVAPNDLTRDGRYSSYDPEFYGTQFQLIKSHAVARRVVSILSLEEKYDQYLGKDPEERGFFQSLFGWLGGVKSVFSKILGSAPSKTEEEKIDQTKTDLIAQEIRKKIKVSPVEGSRILTISYLSPNPEFSALIANTTAKAYIEEALDMKMEATRRTLEWMTKKADEERSKLEKAEKKLQNYMRSNDIVTLENRVTVVPQKLAEISTELVRAESRRKEQETLYYKVKDAAETPEAAEAIPVIASDSALQEIRTQILMAEKSIMELSGKYGRKHPAMIKALSDLNGLKQKKEKEISRLVQSVKNEYELAASKEENLRAHLNKTKTEALNLNEKFIQYDALKREIETNRQLFDALLLKIKEQSITEETQPVNLWIVEKATPAQAPAKPNKTLNMLLGLFLGVFGGIGLAFFIEYLDNTIKYPEETENALDTSVLGMVPLWKTDSQCIEKIVLEDSRSGMAESYRALRTALLLSSPDHPPKKILITSSGASEGKTTTVTNLALALAQSGKRVLLIDADLRKPQLHKITNLNNQVGLSTYLAGGSSKDCVQEGPLPNIAVITSGPIPPNPSELLTSNRLKSMIDNLSDKFDFIICDSPPLLAVADARILSRFFDSTIMVTKAHNTTFEMASKSLKLLQEINSPVLGIIINAFNVQKSDVYYNNYYDSYKDNCEKVEGANKDNCEKVETANV